MILCESDGCVSLVTTQLEAACGWEEGVLQGQPLSQLLQLSDRAEGAVPTAQDVSQGRPLRAALRRRTGRAMPVTLHLHPADGEGQRYWVTVEEEASSQATAPVLRRLEELASDLLDVGTLDQLTDLLESACSELFQWDSFYFAVRRSGSNVYKPLRCIDTIDGKRMHFTEDRWLLSESVYQRPNPEKRYHVRNLYPEEDENKRVRFGDTQRSSASIISSQIWRRGRYIGMVSAQSYIHGKYEDADGILLRRVADIVAPSLYRCLAEARLALFSGLGRKLGGADTVRRVAEIMLEAADQLIGWDAAYLDVLSADGKQVEFDLNFDIIDGVRRELATTYMTWSQQQLKRVQEGPHLILYEGRRGFTGSDHPIGDKSRPSESLIYCPIRSGPQLVGELSIQSYATGAFDEDDLMTVQALADQCGTALERLRARLRLDESEQIKQQIVDLLPHYICAKDAEGRFLFVNEALARAIGVDREELLGRLDSEFVYSKEDLDRIRRDDLEVIRTGKLKFVHEEVMSPRAGKPRYLQMTRVRVRLPGQGNDAVLVLSLDTTETREAFSLVQQAQKDEGIGFLAGAIAHEFNNLLTGILGNTELVMELSANNEKLLDHAQRIEVASTRAAELTRQLLAYAGKGRTSVERVAVSSLIRAVASRFAPSIPPGVELRVRAEDGAGPISGDSRQLAQCLANIVTNSVEALGEREGLIEIWSEKCVADRGILDASLLGWNLPEGEYVAIAVRDSGPGVDEETKKRMFEPFFSTKSEWRVGGRGLGLSAAMGIVRNHRGAIDVRNVPGDGLTIRLLFPAQGEAESTPVPQAPAVAPESQISPIVLVVDDEELIRSMMVWALQKAGFKTAQAVNGADAIERLRGGGEAIGAVLLDVRLPGMDGVAVFKEMKSSHPDVPIFMMSGYTETEAAEWMEEIRPDAFFVKPLKPSTIVNALKERFAPS